MIGLIPLKVNAGYEFGKGQQKKINHFFFMVDSKLYGNKKRS